MGLRRENIYTTLTPKQSEHCLEEKQQQKFPFKRVGVGPKRANTNVTE